MKKTTKAFFLIAFSMIVLHACNSTSKIAKTNSVNAPTDADYQVGKQKWSDLTSANLQAGYHTYVGKCGQCHDLKIPTDFTEDQWNDIYPKMARKAQLTDSEKVNTYRYIMTMREAGSKK